MSGERKNQQGHSWSGPGPDSERTEVTQTPAPPLSPPPSIPPPVPPPPPPMFNGGAPPPGTVVSDDNDRDLPPPLPVDHPSQRHFRPATNPTPALGQPAEAAPPRALLQLSSAPPQLLPLENAPVVERTLRSPRKRQEEERTESAIDLTGSDQLPFKRRAGSTLALSIPAGGTALVEPTGLSRDTTPLPLPFSADAGDTPAAVQARDAARRQTTTRAPAGPSTAMPEHRPTPQPSGAGDTGGMPGYRDTAEGLAASCDDPLPFDRQVAPQHRPSVTESDAQLPAAGHPFVPAVHPFVPAAHASLPAARPSLPGAHPSSHTLMPTARPSMPATPPPSMPAAIPSAAALASGVARHPIVPNPLRAAPPVVTRNDEPTPATNEDSPSPPPQPLLSVEDYARVKVAIWDREQSLKEALTECNIDEMLWRSNEVRHAARIAHEAEKGEATFAQRVRAAVRKLRESQQTTGDAIMPLEAYAALRVTMENADFVEEVLADTDLTVAQWESVKRGWGKRVGDDRTVGKQLRRAMAKARRAHRREEQATAS